MNPSPDRILTTHVGSLPRPAALIPLLHAQDEASTGHIDPDTVAATEAAIDQMLAQQIANRVDIVSDGEMSKLSYTTYIVNRLDGMAYVENSGALGGTPGQGGMDAKASKVRQRDMAEHDVLATGAEIASQRLWP